MPNLARLTYDFYSRPTLEVARDLLGCRLVRILDGQRLGGRIMETEAYRGEADQASHARRGWSPRVAVMYGPPGYTYVYMNYGIHHGLNVVTEAEGHASAVLIRAIWPDEGVDMMLARRGKRPLRELTNGPGKLCQALGIDMTYNGVNLTTYPDLFIETDEPVPDNQVRRTPRIGVGGDEQAKTVLWRFVVDDRG